MVKAAFNIILYVLLIIAIVLFGTSCKTRKLERDRVRTENLEQAKQVVKVDSTTLSNMARRADVKSVDIYTDSSSTTITADEITAKPDGTYIAKGKATMKKQNAIKKHAQKDSTLSEEATTKTDVKKDVQSDRRSETRRDSLRKRVDSDSTIGANVPWYVWVIAITAILVIIVIWRPWRLLR